MSLPTCEYLVSHGKIGGVGRFLAELPLALRRGTRVVVESPRGLEAGTVLCAATSQHARLLKSTVVGRLLRLLDNQDELLLQKLETRGQRLFDDARRLCQERELPLDVLDVDMMVDGKQAILQHLLAEPCDLAEFVETLQARHGLVVLLENLVATPETEPDEGGGCGEPNCGRKDGGGCTTCGTGGGCSSCGTGKVDMAAYFGHLRAKMEESNRVPLL